MQRLKNKILYVLISLLAVCLFFITPANVYAQNSKVYVGGMPAGFTLGIGGAQIVGICEVLTENGVVSPAKDAELETGDLIVSLGGIKITSAADIDSALSSYKGGKTVVTAERKGEKIKREISPAKDAASGKYKLGILIRDSISGIGTITYITKDGLLFGSLGHSASGSNGNLLRVKGGEIFACTIVNVLKGERGKAGELKGLFVGEKKIATAEKNCETGIYGKFEKDYDFSNLKEIEISDRAEPGKASIFTTVDGMAPKEYSISIIKVDKSNKQNKNFVIKITDKALLKAAGGIVQGMSGSPIIQNGKLIGAVTHVFLNDPTRGYGITVQNMMKDQA